jgi:Na+/H+-translocating membrane pyrophosphatase
MGADLFGSLAESTCAALVVSSTSLDLIKTPEALYFPMMVTATGLLASFFSVLCVHFWKVTTDNVQTVLKMQIALSTIFMTAGLVGTVYTLPETFSFERNGKVTHVVGRW